jgi:hypothetical protein
VPIVAAVATDEPDVAAKSAQQPREPRGQRNVHPVRDAGTQQQLTEQHEQRNRGQQVLVADAPDDIRHRVQERHAVGEHAAENADHQHRHGDRDADQHHPDHHEESDDRGGDH